MSECPRCGTPAETHGASICMDAWVQDEVMRLDESHPLPRYSESIGAAWNVVREMRRRGGIRHGLHLVRFTLYLQRFAALRVQPGEIADCDDWWMWLEPVDICRAALLAVEGRTDE